MLEDTADVEHHGLDRHRSPSSRFATVLIIPGAVGVLACEHRPWPGRIFLVHQRPVRGSANGRTGYRLLITHREGVSRLRRTGNRRTLPTELVARPRSTLGLRGVRASDGVPLVSPTLPRRTPCQARRR